MGKGGETYSHVYCKVTCLEVEDDLVTRSFAGPVGLVGLAGAAQFFFYSFFISFISVSFITFDLDV
jgi:hypothetical protein